MKLFSYKDIVLATAVKSICDRTSCTFEEAVLVSPIFEWSANLFDAVEFLDRRSHVYTYLDPVEAVFDAILRIDKETNYFPEEFVVFAEANPLAAEHHEHFFEFWKASSLHRGFHQFADAMKLLIDGQLYHSFKERIPDDEYTCIGFPGAPNMPPVIKTLIDTHRATAELLGFDPCLHWLNDCLPSTSPVIYGEYNQETQMMESSITTFSGRVYLSGRPIQGTPLSKYIKEVK